MEILDSIWGADDNYAKADSVRQCWKKSRTLSPTAETKLDHKLGYTTKQQC